MTADRIARLKITLDDVRRQVLRRIEVPLTIRLDRLHEVLQAALGCTNSHLYELRPRTSPGLPITASATVHSMPARPGSSTYSRILAPARARPRGAADTAPPRQCGDGRLRAQSGRGGLLCGFHLGGPLAPAAGQGRRDAGFGRCGCRCRGGPVQRGRRADR